jgi:tetratricopeptide (TPR) repeat protein
MDFFVAALTSGWAVGAGLMFSLAALAWLRGPARMIAGGGGLAVAAVLGSIAFFGASQDRTASPELPGAGLLQERGAQSRDAADALMLQAEAELNSGNAASARRSYDQALTLYTEAGDILGAGDVAFGLARLEHFTGQSESARGRFSEAQALYREGRAARQEAVLLAAWGDLEKDTFNWERAREHYRAALALWEQVAPKANEHVLLGLEQLPEFPAGEETARSDLAQARLLYYKVGDPVGLGDVYRIEGRLEFNLGNYEISLAQFAEAVIAYRGAGTAGLEAEALYWVARTELIFGHNVATSDALEKAEALFKNVGSQEGLARSTLLRGDLERIQGRVSLALQNYSAAAEQLRELFHELEAESWLKSGQMERERGASAAARNSFENALRLFGESDDGAGTAEALLSLGLMDYEAGDSTAARQHLARAVESFGGLDHPSARARALVGLGRVEMGAGNPSAARQAFSSAAETLEGALQPFGVALARLALGDLEQSQGDPAAAGLAYAGARRAFDSLDQPVAQANRYLGQPAIERIDLVGVARSQDYQLEAPAEPDERLVEHELRREKNWNSFLNQNFEARRLVQDLVQGLDDAGV